MRMTSVISSLERLYIRVLWVLHATRLKAVHQCPPACGEGHTYKWPCQQRIKKVNQKWEKRYTYYDRMDG